jgi:hypothetical protein
MSQGFINALIGFQAYFLHTLSRVLFQRGQTHHRSEGWSVKEGRDGEHSDVEG